MRWWIIAAISGHLLNGAAFLIDKILLSSSFRKSGTYAALIGGLSCFILPVLPWVDLPSGSAWIPVALFGSLFVLAIWLFFEALQEGEASRIVPIVGVLIPIFTLLESNVFIGERLPWENIWGFLLLITATLILTAIGKKGWLPLRVIAICTASAFLFAASSVAGKAAYLADGFTSVFVASRIFAALTAISIAALAPGVKQELAKLLPHKRDSKMLKAEHRHSVYLMLTGQVAGAFGFLLVQYAISLGSASLVNALQAVQYAFLVLAAWIGGPKLAALLKEDRHTKVIAIKTAAIAFVAIGLYLIAV